MERVREFTWFGEREVLPVAARLQPVASLKGSTKSVGALEADRISHTLDRLIRES